MNNVIQDLSILTTIPEKSLSKLEDKLYYIINDYIIESLLANEKDTSIDFGIGILTIRVEDNNIKYRFTPNAKLESTIKETIINRQNLLDKTLEKNLIEKITNIYKEYI